MHVRLVRDSGSVLPSLPPNWLDSCSAVPSANGCLVSLAEDPGGDRSQQEGHGFRHSGDSGLRVGFQVDSFLKTSCLLGSCSCQDARESFFRFSFARTRQEIEDIKPAAQGADPGLPCDLGTLDIPKGNLNKKTYTSFVLVGFG